MARPRERAVSAVLGAARRPLALARNVRASALADGVAGLRLARRGGGVCLLEGTAAADRGGVPPRGLWNAARRRPLLSMGRGASGSAARKFRFPIQRSRSGRIASGGSERLGRRGSRRQRMGVDVERFRALSRIRANALLSGLLD